MKRTRQLTDIELSAMHAAWLELEHRYRNEEGKVDHDSIFLVKGDNPVLFDKAQRMYDRIYLDYLEYLMDVTGVPGSGDRYIDSGYCDREHYLKSLAKESGMDLYTVKTYAELYGPQEDFDLLPYAVGIEYTQRHYHPECWPAGTRW